jgi:hypothetical protein
VPVIAVFLGTFVAAAWAWQLQRTAVHVFHRMPAEQLAPCGAGASVLADIADTPTPERSSVLGWRSFSLVSVLIVDGSALLNCRCLDQGRPRAVRVEEDRTMVLLIGEDHRADQAMAMLDSWRSRGTHLALRPTDVSGAIEVHDQGHAALRAHLLAV